MSYRARRLWICASCARPARVSKTRCQSTLAARPAGATDKQPLGPPLVDHHVSSRHDDGLLRELFDAPTGRPFARLSMKRNQGLFGNRYLTSPDGFALFARRNLEKAAGIVDRVLRASSTHEYQGIVRDLDRLSDLLCRVLDLSDFVRMMHPDRHFQEAAGDAWSMVYQYMNQLNTMTGLSQQLTEALSRPEVTAAWSEEERTVAELLKLDFIKSAVHLPKKYRDRFVDLSSQISEVGSAFVEGMEPEKKHITLPSHKFYGLPPGLAAARRSGQQISIATAGPEAAAALQSVNDEEVRREIYLAQRTASGETVARLEKMLQLRAELAELAGFESYGHMVLQDRMMAKSPASVMQFLLALSDQNAPKVKQELADLAQAKSEKLSVPGAELQPWDREFYMEKIRAEMRSRVRHEDHLSAFFSVGTVMQGISRLLDRLYGVRFVPREVLPGETWHPDVRRLDVVSDEGERIAVLYCDLFYRPQKPPNPAHFTVRCSRELLADEVEEAGRELASMPVEFSSAAEAANDGMETSSASSDGRLMQLPTIALVCDFAKSERAGEPALLSLHSVETLFHEMGHAVHSILARTRFQNVSGTRCATDLAELPSTLMEHFAADPAVLGLFARHWKTDRQLPEEMVAERARIVGRFGGIDTEHQILLAIVDQAYHAPDARHGRLDSSQLFHQLQGRHGHGPADPPQTRWQGFFGHLHSYGSSYYSYLFDRVLADRVWRVVFSAGHRQAALSRSNGEWLRERLLRWGGARDPWRCLADTLDDDRLAAGDQRAMTLVGSWGIRHPPSS